VSRGEHTPRMALAPSLPLFGCAVKGYERRVEPGLVGRIHAKDLGSDGVADVATAFCTPLPPKRALSPSRSSDRFVGTSRGARREPGPAEKRSVVQRDVNLDGRVAARIEDLSGFDGLDAVISNLFRRRPPVDYWGLGPKSNRPEHAAARRWRDGESVGRSCALRPASNFSRKKLSSAVPRFADPKFEDRLASLIAAAIVAAARRLFRSYAGEAS